MIGIAIVINAIWYWCLKTFSTITVTLVSASTGKYSQVLKLNHFNCSFEKLVTEATRFFGISQKEIFLLVDNVVLNKDNAEAILQKNAKVVVHSRKTFYRSIKFKL